MRMFLGMRYLGLPFWHARAWFPWYVIVASRDSAWSHSIGSALRLKVFPHFAVRANGENCDVRDNRSIIPLRHSHQKTKHFFLYLVTTGVRPTVPTRVFRKNLWVKWLSGFYIFYVLGIMCEGSIWGSATKSKITNSHDLFIHLFAEQKHSKIINMQHLQHLIFSEGLVHDFPKGNFVSRKPSSHVHTD